MAAPAEPAPVLVPETSEGVNADRCYALPDGGAGQRLFLVAFTGQHVPGLPSPLLLPLLRRLGRLGGHCAAGRAAAVRPEAADRPAGLGRADGPRGRGARAPGAPRRRGVVRGTPHRGHGAAHARGVALLAARRLSRAPEGSRRPLRARVRHRGVGPGLAGPPGPRLPLSPELLPAAAASRRSGARRAERWILIEDVRAFEFEGTPIYAAPGLRVLDAGRPARPGRLEDRQPGPRGDGRSSWVATRSTRATSWTCRRTGWISSR